LWVLLQLDGWHREVLRPARRQRAHAQAATWPAVVA
jgi:hypothetical protein